MAEPISRRLVLSGLLTGLSVAAAARAGAVTPPDPEFQGQLRQLNEILQLLEVADSHLTRFVANFISPPDPERPAFLAALDGIDGECSNVMASADELRKLLTLPT